MKRKFSLKQTKALILSKTGNKHSREIAKNVEELIKDSEKVSATNKIFIDFFNAILKGSGEKSSDLPPSTSAPRIAPSSEGFTLSPTPPGEKDAAQERQWKKLKALAQELEPVAAACANTHPRFQGKVADYLVAFGASFESMDIDEAYHCGQTLEALRDGDDHARKNPLETPPLSAHAREILDDLLHRHHPFIYSTERGAELHEAYLKGAADPDHAAQMVAARLTIEVARASPAVTKPLQNRLGTLADDASESTPSGRRSAQGARFGSRNLMIAAFAVSSFLVSPVAKPAGEAVQKIVKEEAVRFLKDHPELVEIWVKQAPEWSKGWLDRWLEAFRRGLEKPPE